MRVISRNIYIWQHSFELSLNNVAMPETVNGDQTVQQNSKTGLTKVKYNLALRAIGQELKLL